MRVECSECGDSALVGEHKVTSTAGQPEGDEDVGDAEWVRDCRHNCNKPPPGFTPMRCRECYESITVRPHMSISREADDE